MMNGKYVMSKFLNVNDMQKAIMEDKELNDLERLLCIFNTMKTDIKNYNPYLYDCLLAINNQYKNSCTN